MKKVRSATIAAIVLTVAAMAACSEGQITDSSLRRRESTTDGASGV